MNYKYPYFSKNFLLKFRSCLISRNFLKIIWMNPKGISSFPISFIIPKNTQPNLNCIVTSRNYIS